jgi:hypothetical protein
MERPVLNGYWVKSHRAIDVECPVCDAPYNEPCITNKNLPHSQGYVHRGREAHYFNTLERLIR